MAKQKKNKKFRRFNLNETTDENKVESDSETSSQEEDSTKVATLTSKRKPNTISPPENQLKSKIVNCTATPKATSNDHSTSSNDSERLIVDESNQTNEELNSTALSNTDNVTKTFAMTLILV